MDSVAGSNTNPGTAAEPFLSISFALLVARPGSTVVLADSGAPYSPSQNGEAFPLCLDRVELRGDCAGDSLPVIDGEGLPVSLVKLDESTAYDGTICGIEFRNAGRGIESMPIDLSHEPLIENCYFADFQVAGVEAHARGVGAVRATIRNCTFQGTAAFGDGIVVGGDAGSTVAPTLADNTFVDWSESIVYDVAGCAVDALIEGNTFESTSFSFSTVVLLEGIPASGVTRLRQNTVDLALGARTAFQLSGFGGQLEMVGNTSTGAGVNRGLQFLNSLWNADSSVRSNDFRAEGTGVEIRATDDVRLEGNTCEGGAYGVRLMTGSERVTLEGNRCQGDSGPGIRIEAGCDQAVIVGNDVSSSSDCGIDSRSDEAQFRGNTARSNGLCGIVSDGSQVQIDGNCVLDNGGVGIEDAFGEGTQITGNVVAQNSLQGILVSATSTTAPVLVVGNTIADNGAEGLLSNAGAGGVLANGCILWGNNGAGCDVAGLAPNDFAYCDVEDCGNNLFGNIVLDPLFVDALAGDYRLDPASPAIDSGDPLQAPGGTDKDGNPLVLDGDLNLVARRDMGALEYNTVQLSIDDLPASLGETLVLDVDAPPGWLFTPLASLLVGDFPLDNYGSLLLGIQTLTAVPGGVAPGSTPVVVPMQAALVGQTIYFQVAAVATSGLAGSLSNRVAAEIVEP